MISTRVCKKIFLIKAKKNFVLGVSKFRTKTFIFEYFPKIPSEMNSKHPFYSILIPMTSHAKIFILVVGGPKGVPERCSPQIGYFYCDSLHFRPGWIDSQVNRVEFFRAPSILGSNKTLKVKNRANINNSL